MLVVLRAQPVPLAGDVLPMLSLRSREDLEQFVKGSDIDLGECLFAFFLEDVVFSSV